MSVIGNRIKDCLAFVRQMVDVPGHADLVDMPPMGVQVVCMMGMPPSGHPLRRLEVFLATENVETTSVMVRTYARAPLVKLLEQCEAAVAAVPGGLK